MQHLFTQASPPLRGLEPYIEVQLAPTSTGKIKMLYGQYMNAANKEAQRRGCKPTKMYGRYDAMPPYDVVARPM